MRDIAAQNELTAACLASLAGNSGVDLDKIKNKITNAIDKVHNSKFPYVKIQQKVEEVSNEHKYDKYFKYLEELEEQDRLKQQDNSDAVPGDTSSSS